jgi:L,D-peptidoglycan transpeptidase YkuD (ErfK/YbiS/YcfS/YnhG family)
MLLAALLGVPVVDGPVPVRQVVVVTGQDWRSQQATLRRFERSGDSWVRVGPRVSAWIGVNGFVRDRARRQNSGQTPAGVFTLPQAFGAVAGHAVSLPYRRITAHSYWPYDPQDPRTYNVLQPRRATGARWRADGRWSERLASYGAQYRYAVVIGYNLPHSVYRDRRTGEWRARIPARTHRGGGIFLHVDRGRPTAGCVAIGRGPMRSTVRWLDPAANPRIVMGPPSITGTWRQRVG